MLPSKQKQRILTLAVLALILLVVTFQPALPGLLALVTRTNPVQSGKLQATIPRWWPVDTNGGKILAEQPCLTVFCALPSASITIESHPEMIDNEDVWQSATERLFERLGFEDHTLRQLETVTNRTLCVEGTHPASHRVRSICLVSSYGLITSFAATKSMHNLNEKIVESVELVP